MNPYPSIDRGATLQVSTNSDRRSFDPVFLFVLGIAAYVTLQTLTVLTFSGILKALSYAAAFGIVLVMGLVAAYMPKRRDVPLGFGIALILYFYGFIASAAFNSSVLDYGTAIKMLLVPLFLVIGAAFESQNRFRSWNEPSTKVLFGVLIVLPLLLWIFQLVTGKISFGGIGYVAIFANRNNAGLYAVTLIALLNVLRPQPVANLLLFCIVGAAFGTLGVLLAVVAAITLAVGNRRTFLLMGAFALVASVILYFVPLEYGVFARLKPVIASIKLIVDGRVDIATVSYGELVGMLKTTDLSFIFRLKHWLNLWDLYINAPFENIVFGFGVGSSVWLSQEGLVPHNDYLRMLFECGPITFIGFVYLIVLVIKNCGRRWESVPLLAVTIYFVTENLIDNFAAMTLFFFCSGAMAYRVKSLTSSTE